MSDCEVEPERRKWVVFTDLSEKERRPLATCNHGRRLLLFRSRTAQVASVRAVVAWCCETAEAYLAMSVLSLSIEAKTLALQVRQHSCSCI